MATQSVLAVVGSLAEQMGGPSRTVPLLCRALLDLGVQVEIVTTTAGLGSEGRPSHCAEVPATLVPCWYSPRTRVVWAPGFRRSLRERLAARPGSILHDNGLWMQTNHDTAVLARRQRVPRVLSPRGMVTAWALQHKAWKKGLAWRLYQKRDLVDATAFHATSDDEAACLRRLGLSQPIAVVPNGIEVPPQVSRTSAPAGPRVLLFLSRVHPNKGLLNLARAWAEVRPNDWRCVIAGPDEDGHRAEVERAVRDAGVESEFSFAGLVQEAQKWDLFARADLFVLPSFSENFGLVVGEALAAGVPVITTRGTPWRELVTQRCGWWVDIGVEPLAAALREAVSCSDAERAEMGRRGRRLVEEKYAWPAVAQQMKALYEWVLGGGPAPGCVQART